MSQWNGRELRKIAQAVASRYGTDCWLCGEPITGQVSPDHVVPVSKGGSNDLDNLRPSHLNCNKRRGNRQAPARPVISARW